MIPNFKRRAGTDSILGRGLSTAYSSGDLTAEEQQRLERIQQAWNFYEGYHWEGVDDLGSPQVTFNYCKPFINKFVSFEFGSGFTINSPRLPENVLDEDTNHDGVVEGEEVKNISPEDIEFKTVKEQVGNFLNRVWDENSKEELCVEIGQNKSITGDAWIKVMYESPEEMEDIFDENPEGKIRLEVFPTQYMFPEFDEHDKKRMINLLIMYPISVERETGILRRKNKLQTILYKELWTKEKITIYHGADVISEEDNPYGFIPFVHIKNFIISGKNFGASDIDDIIPLNVEVNTKRSDVSEIIDYHSAPITCVYGAKIGNLEKGANKVWGGLPKDSRVENLQLQGDLQASTQYIKDLKTAMCEIGGVPETVLGGASAISNTSGVALQYMNLPLVEKTKIKRACSESGLVIVNKMILKIALQMGFIEKPENMSMKEFLYNKVTLPDTLPKDELIELQKIQQEMLMGLECRHGAMERLGKENITSKLNEIDVEREAHPEIFNSALQQLIYQNKLNSGMTNGETPVEQVRKEVTGQNGGGDI